MLDIDVQGALSVLRKLPEAAFIFIAPPSFQDLKVRLTERKTESQEDLSRRLDDARWELSRVKDFGYLMVNRDLDDSVRQLGAVIVAEQIRIERMKDRLGQSKSFWEDD